MWFSMLFALESSLKSSFKSSPTSSLKSSLTSSLESSLKWILMSSLKSSVKSQIKSQVKPRIKSQVKSQVKSCLKVARLRGGRRQVDTSKASQAAPGSLQKDIRNSQPFLQTLPEPFSNHPHNIDFQTQKSQSTMPNYYRRNIENVFKK